jgi:hypothetical protein
VLVAYLVLVAVNFAIGFAAFIMAIPIGFAVFSDLRGGVGIAVIAIAGLIAVIVVLAYLLFVFFIQFYGQAIVIDDLGAVDGLKHSYTVVRGHLASALGYSVLVGVLGGLAGGVFAIASMLVSPQSTTVLSLPQLSVVSTVVVALLLVVLGALFGVFFGVYSVAFYRTIDSGVADGS